MILDDRTFLKQRNHLGRMFGQLKIIRVIATRGGETAEILFGLVHIASARCCLTFVHAA